MVSEIEKADALEIENALKAVLKRCAVLFPDWELSIISLQKSSDKKEQLDRIIEFLQKRKDCL